MKVSEIIPKWTVHYSIAGDPWDGSGWEFFNEYGEANKRYLELIMTDCCPSLRPFQVDDLRHLYFASLSGIISKLFSDDEESPDIDEIIRCIRKHQIIEMGIGKDV